MSQYDEERQGHLNYKYKDDPRDQRPDDRTGHEIACDAIVKAHDQLTKKLNFCAEQTLKLAIERLKL